MRRRSFLGSLAAVAVLSFHKPLRGLGFGQSEIEPIKPKPEFHSCNSIEFPYAASNWGDVAYVGVFKTGRLMAIITLDGVRRVVSGDVLSAKLDSPRGITVRVSDEYEAGLLGPNGQEVSGLGYARVKVGIDTI